MDIFTWWWDVRIRTGFCWLTIGSCGHGDGPSGSRKGREFLDYQFLKTDPAGSFSICLDATQNSHQTLRQHTEITCECGKWGAS
jgi:hypothetical protein